MTLVGPWLTTLSYKRRKTKITKSQQIELEQGWRDRNVWLKQLGLPKETFDQYCEWVYGRGKKIKTQQESTIKPASVEETIPRQAKTKPWITGPCSTKKSPTYTGENILGVAIMHKSNLVPVFSNKEAEEISKMRR